MDVKEKTQYTGFASDTQTTGLLSKKLNFTNNEDPFAEIYNVSETDLPIVISGQINKMQELRKNVDDAIQKASLISETTIFFNTAWNDIVQSMEAIGRCLRNFDSETKKDMLDILIEY
ncbi:MAG: hypothetical protein IJ601_00780 [Acidaminococcaceae bacterium]|nr:hypothetical protein [Acidaminococcaceae bacterium]